MLHLRILEHLLHVVDRPQGTLAASSTRSTRACRRLHDSATSGISVPRLTMRPDIMRKPHPRPVRCRDLAQAGELAVVADGENDLAVLHGNTWLGHDVGMGGCRSAFGMCPNEVAADSGGVERDHAVEQRHVDVLAAPRARSGPMAAVIARLA